jgi:hypothetical protein
VGVDHHDHERIVELTRVPTQFEAEVLIAKLHANGIDAILRDAGNVVPHFSIFDGHGVFVFDGDLERAAAVIAEE